jgi:predicted TIM-barrel fold metal-dependent hydrolase
VPEPSQIAGLTDSEPHTDVAHFLNNARREARVRNYDRFPIVDVDAHHYDSTYAPWKQIVKLIEDPVIQRRAVVGTSASGAASSIMPRGPIGDRTVGGRIQRYGAKQLAEGQTDVEVTKQAMDAMGIDVSILFPTALLNMGVLPEVDVQVAISRAYARWLTEEVLPREPRLRTMVSLPFNDPAASLRMVEEFGQRPGVVGFVVGSTFYRPVHHRDYLKIYAAIEERGLPLGFHSAYHWQDRLTEQFNKFLSAHGIGRTLFNIVHLTNIVVNGIPERFPGLRLIWIESGITWIPFVMQRLDNEYLMRSSEAPLLTKRPSEYMREFFYTAQPLERSNNQEMMRITFEMIGAETQLLYASDYPHWDFDLPSSIYDLPFLSEPARRRILGQNAIDLFGLEIAKPSPVAAP